MDFFDIGDLISTGDLNAIVYLLRKFKRLNEGLRLGNLRLESDYGTFVFDKALTSIGGNFIIEEEVNVSSSDCLRNCFYTFLFSVIDVNTSGTVNKRQVKVTGNTGENGELFITLPADLIEHDEVILPNFEVDIVFDEHEYYTPVAGLNVDLTVEKPQIIIGGTNKITATVTEDTGEPVTGLSLQFKINGVSYTETTDSSGVAEYVYTATSVGRVIVTVSGRSISFEVIDGLKAIYTGNRIRLGRESAGIWLVSTGSVVIDWGDGTSDTVNNPTSDLTHSYTDGESSHIITFIGEITSLGDHCFGYCSGLTSVVIPNSVTSLGNGCFEGCEGLTSVVIPNSVTSLGNDCFEGCEGLTSVVIPNSVTSLGNDCFRYCSALIDYQLYWVDNAIITYNTRNMPNNTNTVFTIPYGQTSNYVAKNYPSNKLSERASGKTITTLTIQSNKATYYTDESIILTGALVDENNTPLTSTTVKLYQDNQLIDTLTTDSNGEYSKTITGLSVGAYTFKAIYDGDTTYEASTSSNLPITVQNHTYNLSIASDKQAILTTESVIISGQLTKDSTPYSSQSIQLYDGAIIIDTITTDGTGNYSKTISGLTVGTHTFKAVNSNAESSTISITVSEPVHDYSLSVVSDKDILSYADSESATITATLTDNSSPASGETLTYTIKHGATTITTGSDTTDANGEITITYPSTGIGDVDIEVNFGILLQERFVIQDCLKVITDFTTGWTTSGAVSSYNGYTVPDNVEIIWAFDNNIDKVRVGIGSGTGQYGTVYYHNPSTAQGVYYYAMYYSGTQTLHRNKSNLTTNDVLKLQLTGTTAKWLLNDTEFDTGTFSTSYRNNIRLVDKSQYSTRYILVKAL